MHTFEGNYLRCLAVPVMGGYDPSFQSEKFLPVRELRVDVMPGLCGGLLLTFSDLSVVKVALALWAVLVLI